MWLSAGFEDDDGNTAPPSPDSTPLDLTPNMAAEPPPDGKITFISTPKTDPDQIVPVDPDPERSADREAVALAMVTDLTQATRVMPLNQDEIPETTEKLQQPRKKQRKRPREDEKICLVCGDKALAHNFDAITCESCKAFFRRNALRMERMNCLFTGECEINIQTRRFCPTCRLKKCFAVGMKADLILDDSERRARMEKVSENRAKRQGKDGNESGESQVDSSGQIITSVTMPDFTSTGRSSAPTPPTPLSSGASISQDTGASTPHPLPSSRKLQRKTSQEGSRNGLSTLHAVLTAASAISDAGATPVLNIPATGYPQVSQSHVVSTPPPPQTTQPPHLPSQNPVSSSASGASHFTPDFQHVPRDVLPSDPHMYWRLSEEEKTLLTELSSAYQTTIMTLPERVPCEGGGLLQTEEGTSFGLQTVEHIFETSEKNMRQLIDFVQRLGDFHLMREDDKISVLQASCMRSVILRWTGLYVVERNSWLTRFGECSVSTACVIFGHEDVIQDMAAFCRSMKIILKNDVTLFVLTHCLLLFDPREQTLVDRQLINSFRDKYLILLKHYLESEYSFLFSDRYLQALMDKIIEIRHVADKCLRVMKHFQEYIPPLTKQLLNLHEIH
ncbi:uncharacterized protein LOC143297522 isoform X2 [Babylonia areolata]|uniref:uncharacterized protein LOC143297522 isoform X2 n=1 Tax=Babylonia areolata TaxID=304850 RepID=UPI003FCF8BFF